MSSGSNVNDDAHSGREYRSTGDESKLLSGRIPDELRSAAMVPTGLCVQILLSPVAGFVVFLMIYQKYV